MSPDYLGFAYAATVVTGGIVGYARAQSVPSLVAGCIFGIVLCYGAYQVTLDPKNISLSLGASLFLSGLMGYRFVVTGKFMPSVLVFCVSVLNVIRLLNRSNMRQEGG